MVEATVIGHHEENNAAPWPPGGRTLGWYPSTRAPPSRPCAGTVPFRPGAPLSPRALGRYPSTRAPPSRPGDGLQEPPPGRWLARASALPSEVFYSPPGG